MKDLRIENNEAEASLLVSEPDHLQMVIREEMPDMNPTANGGAGFDPYSMEDWESLYSQSNNNWNLIEGKRYYVLLQVENANSETLALPANAEVEFVCDGKTTCEHLEVDDLAQAEFRKQALERQYLGDSDGPVDVVGGAKSKSASKNFWVVPFTAKKAGQTTIGFQNLRFKYTKTEVLVTKEGETKKVKDKKTGKETEVKGKTTTTTEMVEYKSFALLSTSRTVRVFPKLSVAKSEVVLPPNHEFYLSISGGSGAYDFDQGCPSAVDGVVQGYESVAHCDRSLVIVKQDTYSLFSF